MKLALVFMSALSFSALAAPQWTSSNGTVYNLSTKSYATADQLLADKSSLMPWWGNSSQALAAAQAFGTSGEAAFGLETNPNYATAQVWFYNTYTGGGASAGWLRGGSNINTTGSSYQAKTFLIATPAAPPVPVISNMSIDTGASGSDRYTADKTPTVSGTAQVNSTVILYVNEIEAGTTTANSSGNWSFTLQSQVDGQYSVTAKAQDTNGTSAATSAFEITIDTLEPTIGATILLDVGSNSGSRDDLVTNDNTPMLRGTAEANAKIYVYANGNGSEIGTVFADGSGQWSLTTSSLSDGDHAFYALAEDLAGNFSSPSSSLSITVDTVANSPGVNLQSSSLSNNTKPQINGTAEPFASVDVYLNGFYVDKVSADSSGNWNYAFTRNLIDRTHEITVRQTDIAANISPLSQAIPLTIDTTPPYLSQTITLSNSTDTGRVNSDGVTKTISPQLEGISEAGAIITIYQGTTLLGEATADSQGKWVFVANSRPEGSNQFSARARDLAGNEAKTVATLSILIDQTVSPPSGSLNTGTLSRDSSPTLSGLAEPGALIDIYKDNQLVAQASADAQGRWKYSFSNLSEGVYVLEFNQTDLAGNQSAKTLINLTVDKTAPQVPTGALDQSVVTGMNDSSLTSSKTPVIAGAAEPGSKVLIYYGGVLIGESSVNGSGQWSFTLTQELAEGPHSFSLKSIDSAGNMSAMSSPFNVLVDSVKPEVEVIGPTDVQNGPFTVTIRFDEDVWGFGIDDISIQHGQVTALRGGQAEYFADILPEMGQSVVISIQAGVAHDSANNLSLSSLSYSVYAGSPKSEMQVYAEETQNTVVDQAQMNLKNALSTNTLLMREARERFMLDTRSESRGLSAGDGIPLVSASGQGGSTAFDLRSDFNQIQLVGDVRRVLRGNVMLNKVEGGSTSVHANIRLATERRISENNLLAVYVNADFGEDKIENSFKGTQDSFSLGLGGYLISRLAQGLYLDSSVGVSVRDNDLSMANDVLSLTSDYRSFTGIASLSLTGVVSLGKTYELWPELAANYSHTRIGEIRFTGQAYGLTDSNLVMDMGSTSSAMLSFAPELRWSLDDKPVESSQSVVNLAPRLVCESVKSTYSYEGCGTGYQVRYKKSWDDAMKVFTLGYVADTIDSITNETLNLEMKYYF
jgi:hypothetical protein